MSWTITIHGFGSHCNRGNPPADADVIAAKLVQDLRAAGHRVDSATFTHGRVEDLAARPIAEPKPDSGADAPVSPDAPFVSPNPATVSKTPPGVSTAPAPAAKPSSALPA